jgi:hypothetical protein
MARDSDKFLVELDHPSRRVQAGVMTASPISALRYSIDHGHSLTWTAAQEKSISGEYPFSDLNHETAEHFVARTYLQFLWLPEVNPLFFSPVIVHL